MTKQSSIQYISGLLDNPAAIADDDQSSIALFRQTYPYFAPVRYLDAIGSHKKMPFAPEMLSAIKPYMGDWMMLCDLLNASVAPAKPEVKKEVKPVQPAAAKTPGFVKQEAKRNLNNIPTDKAPGTSPPPVAATPPATVAETVGVIEKTIPQPAVAAEPVALTKEEPQIIIAEPQQPQVTDAIHDTAPSLTAPVEVPVTQIPVPDVAALTETAIVHNVVMPAEAPAAQIAVQEIVAKPATNETVAPEQVTEQQVPVSEAPKEEVDPFAQLMAGGDDSTRVLDKKSVDVQQPQAEPVAEQITATPAQEAEVHKNQHWIVDEPGTDVPAEATVAPVTIPGEEPAAKIADIITPMAMPAEEAKAPGPQTAVESEAVAEEKPLIYPVYTEDYFLQQGVKVSAAIPAEIDEIKARNAAEEKAKSLMVMMSFSEWLMHFKSATEKQKEEKKDQKALKSMWQKEKLAAAMEEENEEIPENVFEMAVNSIAKEDGLASESLAEIYIKQEKYDKAIEMYRKLSLRNPQKNAYFARKIEEVLKEKQS